MAREKRARLDDKDPGDDEPVDVTMDLDTVKQQATSLAKKLSDTKIDAESKLSLIQECLGGWGDLRGSFIENELISKLKVQSVK